MSKKIKIERFRFPPISELHAADDTTPYTERLRIHDDLGAALEITRLNAIISGLTTGYNSLQKEVETLRALLESRPAVGSYSSLEWDRAVHSALIRTE